MKNISSKHKKNRFWKRNPTYVNSILLDCIVITNPRLKTYFYKKLKVCNFKVQSFNFEKCRFKYKKYSNIKSINNNKAGIHYNPSQFSVEIHTNPSDNKQLASYAKKNLNKGNKLRLIGKLETNSKNKVFIKCKHIELA